MRKRDNRDIVKEIDSEREIIETLRRIDIEKERQKRKRDFEHSLAIMADAIILTCQ